MLTERQLNEIIWHNIQLQAELVIIKDLIREEDTRQANRHQAKAEGHIEAISVIMSEARTIHT